MALEAFEVFPEEVWLMIIKEVKDPQTWLNLSRTCSSLQRVMEPRKLFALLPAVLEPVKKYLTREEMLDLRLVCKDWRATVDNVAEQELVKKTRLSQCRRTFETMEFSSSAKILKFIEDMGWHVGNPFIGRTLCFGYDENEINDNNDDDENEDEEKRFWNSAEQLLQKFGQHIESISLIAGSEYDQDVNQIVVMFVTLLKSMPGLKAIEIDFYDQRGVLRDDIWNNNQPVFKDLEIIRLDRLSRSNTTVLLRALHKMCLHPDKVNHLGVFSGISSSLCTLFPNVETVEGLLSNVLDDLKEINWPLKMFHSDFESICGGLWGFQDTFLVFQRFAKTLTTLILPYGMTTVEKGMLENVNLPNLKLLKLCRIKCKTLDFLLELDSLDEMTLRSIEFNRPRPSSVKDYSDGDILLKTDAKAFENVPAEAKVLPFLSKYLNKKDFLQLRLVSPAWKDAVDKLAECERVLKHEGRFMFEDRCFMTELEIEKFLKKVGTYSGNPFVGRSVLIGREFFYNRDDEIMTENFWSSAFKLLDRFGSHMHKLTLTHFYFIKTKKDYLTTCHRLVNLLKLRVLDIHGEGYKFYDDDVNMKVIKNSDQLQNFVPALLHLEALRVKDCSENGFLKKLLFPIVHKMCLQPQKVTALSLPYRYYSEKLPLRFPNVQVLEGSFDEEDFASLENSGWRLKTLTYKTNYALHLPVLKFDKLLPFMQALQETLTTLTLQDVVFEGTCMNLPNLNTLNLGNVKTRSLKIFSGLPKLNQMRVLTFHFKRKGKFL